MTEQESQKRKTEVVRENMHLYYSKNPKDRDKLSEQEQADVKEISKEMYDKIILHILFEDIAEIHKSIKNIDSTLEKLSRRPWKFGKAK